MHIEKETRSRIAQIAGIVAPLLLGIAVGVSGLINLKFAEVLLWLCGVGFWLMVVTSDWLWDESVSRKIRGVISIGSFVLVFLSVVIFVHFLRIQVAAIEAVALLLALLETVTVIVGGEGIEFGAVYKPAGEIVSAVALPPATPPANHVTLLLDAPVTIAWNCCDWLRATLTCVGSKAMVTTAGPV